MSPGFRCLSRFYRAALVALTFCLPQLGAPTQAQVGANMKDQLIFGYCSRAMAADLDKAGTTPPAGMVDHTCGCVVQQINSRASIDQAKAICQTQAQQKYALQ